MATITWDSTTGTIDTTNTDNDTVVDGLVNTLSLGDAGVINADVDLERLQNVAQQLYDIGVMYSEDTTPGITQ